jgi:MoaA/NifB/PqqE/SkfB family radical SAM enzyme
MTGTELRLQYRGDLASCNYDCGYCPFAKRRDSADVSERDRAALQRFVTWCETAAFRLRLLFTPWGEALVRKHYREAIVRLSHVPQVLELGVQTNLSRNPEWLMAANPRNLQLWCTYHPSQTERANFLRRIDQLLRIGVGFSVGMVALREELQEIQFMRQALDQRATASRRPIYLWLNAFDGRSRDYYSPDMIQTLNSIDPHFAFNLEPVASLGADCRAGSEALSVNARGDVQPCHFVNKPLGNLYDGSFSQSLVRRLCPNARCDCYIGYSLRRDLLFQAPLTRGFAPAAV